MSKERFQQLTQQGFQALHGGDPQRASGLLELALEAARSCDNDLVDEARVNLSQALEQCGQLEEAERGLREILMRSRRSELIFSAAITIARVRKGLSDIDRAQFYLKRALATAREMSDDFRIASALTSHANLLMNQNRFVEASEVYASVLDHLDSQEADGFLKAVTFDNLGYCLVLCDQVNQGIDWLKRSVAESEKHGIRRYWAESSQDLCFAYLKQDHVAEALSPGETALRISEQEGYEDITKNVLFLLGEVHSRLGEHDVARDYYSQLQDFYPGMQDLSAFLSTYDISSMITLKEF